MVVGGGMRASDTEAPVVECVDDPQEYRQARHRRGREEELVSSEFQFCLVGERALDLLRTTAEDGFARRTGAGRAVLVRQRGEDFGRDGAFALVELCDVVQDSNGFLVLTAVEEVFGRLLEAEDNEAEEENAESDASDGEEKVPPTHVTFFGTAWCTGRDLEA